jgi:hypothetical protein
MLFIMPISFPTLPFSSNWKPIQRIPVALKGQVENVCLLTWSYKHLKRKMGMKKILGE